MQRRSFAASAGSLRCQADQHGFRPVLQRHLDRRALCHGAVEAQVLATGGAMMVARPEA